MNTFKKTAALLLVCCMLLPALSGCHGAKEQTAFAVPERFDDTVQYEITFWAKNDTNKTQVAIYKQAIEDFQQLYPNITVNLRLYTDYGKIYNDVITNISTGTTPNVCITYPDHVASYLEGDGVVVALDELLEDPRYGLGGSEIRFDAPKKSEITPAFLKECIVKGQYYLLPFMRSTEACYVNKTYVEALGFELPEVLTWDFVFEVSEAAARKDENGVFAVNGQKVMLPFIYKSTDNMMIQYLKETGAGYSDAAGNILLFSEETKAFLQRLAEETGKGAFSTFKISGYPANFLNAGQCIFAVDSTAGSTWMGSNAPLLDIAEDKLVDFETAVFPVPQADPEHPVMISQGPSLCIFNKEDPGEVLASWIFAQYLLTDEVQIGYSSTEGYAPVTDKAQSNGDYQAYLAMEGADNDDHYSVKLQATKLLLNNRDNTFVTPVFNGSASLRDAAGQLIENTVKSVRRKETVDDAYYEKLYADVRSLYRLDRISPAEGTTEKDLGPLPTPSVVLLSSLAAVWACILACGLLERLKDRKKKSR